MVFKAMRKPLEIEFVVWDGKNLKEVIEFTGKHYKFDVWFKSFKDYERRVMRDGVFKIFNEQGRCQMARVGDYIVKGGQEEFPIFPCRPDIFLMKYDINKEKSL